MMLDQLIVTSVGLSLVLLIVWFFWMRPTQGRWAALDGRVQEALISVKGGYTPDTVIVRKGMPVRLHFRRLETASCSEMVLLPDFGKSLKLPTNETVTVEILPNIAGEFEFACQMGMLRGKLIVE